MRSYNINPDGSGNGAGSDFVNRILKRFTELQFFDSQTVKVEQTTRGTTFHVKASKGSVPAAETTAGFYKGEWDIATQCEVQKMYTRGVLGEFICVAAPPIGTAPETGAPYWHALQNVPPGQWA